MPMMIVRHKVEDYKKWRSVFDAAYDLRRASGEQSCQIFRNTADPNEITLLVEWDNIQKAAKYSQNKLFKEAMKKAGATSEPVLYLPDEEE